MEIREDRDAGGGFRQIGISVATPINQPLIFVGYDGCPKHSS